MKKLDPFRHTPETLILGLVISLLVIFVLVLISKQGWIQQWDLLAYDKLVSRSADQSVVDPNVVIIGISEKDIQSESSWPLSDEKLAMLIEAIKARSPAAIGIDIYRDKPVIPGRQRLIDALDNQQNIFLVEKFRSSEDELGIRPDSALVTPDQTGFSDLPIDDDGIVRRGLLFLNNADSVAYALSLRLAVSFLATKGIGLQSDPENTEYLRLGEVTYRPLETNDGGYVGLDASGYQYLLSMRQSDRSFPMYDMASVLSGSIPAMEFTNKTIIVGVVSASVKDAFFTPLSKGNASSPSTPGVVVHAHATSQLINSALNNLQPTAVVSDIKEFLWVGLWALLGFVVAMLANAFFRYVIGFPVALIVLALTTEVIFVDGLWLPVAAPFLGFFFSFLLVSGLVYVQEKKRREMVMDLFSRHVSSEVAEKVWEQRDTLIKDGRLKAQQTTATIMFTDLVGYTTTAEKMDADALMTWLNNYMEVMAACVFRQGGVIDDYLGDAIKADFGVLLAENDKASVKNNAIKAAKCALEMDEELSKLNQQRIASGLPTIAMRVGIATGGVIAGSLGSSKRLKYTTIGDTVNIAARLESYGRNLPKEDGEFCTITIDESTQALLPDTFNIQKIGELFLKGKEQGLVAYKLA